MFNKRIFLAMATVAVLAGCGGGSEDTPYGSLAYNPVSYRVGGVGDASSASQAKNEAISTCATGCITGLEFSGSGVCGASVAGFGGSKFVLGFATGKSKTEAINNAIGECGKKGGKQCGNAAAGFNNFSICNS